MSDPIAVLSPSPPRRILATAMLVTLAALLLWLALSQPVGGLGWRVLLLMTGAAAGIGAVALWRATARRLTLRAEGLFEEGGRQLCAIDDVASVERGAFAFKPSNGFLIRLKRPGDRAWAPGLWWRIGRRLGVGGVTAAAPARFMAELLAARAAGGTWPPHDGRDRD